jgi:hypothetical protein
MKRRERDRPEARQHTWVLAVIYRLDPWQARQLATGKDPRPVGEVRPGEFPPAGDDRVWLRAEMVARDLMAPRPMCYVCERSWSEEAAAAERPGEPPGRLEYVR